MLFTNWLENSRSTSPSGRAKRYGRRGPVNRAATRRLPRLESLEERTLLSTVSFSAPATTNMFGGALQPESIAVGDFNRDGKPDLVTPNAFGDNVSVLLGNGDGTFQPTRFFAAGTFPWSVAVGDFNGDQKPDLVVANGNSNNVSVLLGNGDGTFQNAQNFAAGANPVSVAVGDLNGDGKLDLAVANSVNSLSTFSVLLGNGDGSFGAVQSYPADAFTCSISIGDFNGDGKPDLTIVNLIASNSVSVLLGNGDGTFQTAQTFGAGFTPDSEALGDFNGDGKLDIAVANRDDPYVSVLLGNGDGTFETAQNYGALDEAVTVAAADLNGDGKLDLVVADEPAGLSVLLGNGDGTFQADTNFDPGQTPTAAAVGDFNGDGKPDIAVANELINSYSVLLNQIITTTAVTAPASATYGAPVMYTASVMNGAAPVTQGTVTFQDDGTPLGAAVPLDSSGQATFSFATLNAGSHTISAVYSGVSGGAGTTGFGVSVGNTSLLINPTTLSATGVNVSANVAEPFTGTVATFTNPDPVGTADSYFATITWGDGTSSAGSITGSGTLLTVTGTHTYDHARTDTVSVQIDHVFGNTTTATTSATATLFTLVRNIGFWQNKRGQALIESFNGGAKASALSTWLATSFPKLYGAGAGANNLTGKRDNQVAAFYVSQFALDDSGAAAEVLATALNVYATTQSLGGAAGQAYGFTVSAAGLGADSFNVGADGAAFGVAKKSVLTVLQLLQSVNRQAVSGVLYDGDPTLQKLAYHLLHGLNKAGSIS